MSYQSTILADSPVAYWRLDETVGSTAADSSGNNRNATYAGSCTLAQPKLIQWDGFSVQFDGSTAYVDASTSAMNAIAGGAFTMEVWFSPANTAIKQCLFGVNRGTNNGPQVYYSHPTFGGAGKFDVFDSTSFNEFSSTNAYTSGTLFVVWRVASDGSTTLRVNGNAEGSNVNPNSNMLVVSGDTFQLGMDIDAGPTNSDWLFGTVDEMAIFASNLSDGTVDAHYAAGQQSITSIPAFAWYGHR